MSQDVVSDTLNKIMNAKKAKKKEVVVALFSKVLLNVLKIAKDEGYVSDFKVSEKELKIFLNEELNVCKTIKPRYNVTMEEIESYMRRYLPARDMGILIISTNKGLLTHKQAYEQNLGGVLIAYFY
jgi:small subunit ribosomal protein S8